MATRITCLGEGLMDFLPISEDGATVGFRLAPGGSVLNVAVGLARLGAEVAFAGKLADDFFGRRLRAYLRAEGVRLDYLASAPGHTTLAFVAPPDAGESQGKESEPSFLFYGDGAADTLLTLADLPAALYAETRILHIGSISLLRGTTPAAVAAVAGRLRGWALISLDPNIRSALVTDAASYRATLDPLIAGTDALKLSLADLAWLEPGAEREEPLAVASRWLARGPALVALTLGAAGAVLATAGGVRLRVSAPAVAVADTVGAGDAFAAGLLGALAERGVTSRAALLALPAEALAEALRWAVTVAALACARPGASAPTRDETLAALPATPEPQRKM
ncbi:MAG: carbohydrate kinase [Chloroflexota bacterium]|nr:carbohydrate kinase [Chloroflexota bacterium]